MVGANRGGLRGLGWAIAAVGTLALFAAVISVPVLRSAWVASRAVPWVKAPALAKPQPRVKNARPGHGLGVSGQAFTTLRNFVLDDHQGRHVLQVGELYAHIDADALRNQLVRMPKGRAEHVKLLLTRGPSGRVSLAETVGKKDPTAPAEGGMLLDLGPLEVRDIRVDVRMREQPVTIQLSRATLRVQRPAFDQKPKLFLSKIQGRLLEPSPLDMPIEILDGVGVVDLAEGPLVDMRVRVCVAGGELRIRILVPTRQPEVTELHVDAEGAMGYVASGVMGLVGTFKDSLEVHQRVVEVEGDGACEASE